MAFEAARGIEVAVQQDIKLQCGFLIEQRVSARFHEYLRQSPEEFRESYSMAIKEAQRAVPAGGAILSLVESRIPLKDQFEMIGVEINPTVFRFPDPINSQRPYVAWLKVVDIFRARTARESAERLADSFVPATAYEGAGADMNKLLASGFSVIAGDLVSGQSKLCFDRWFGRPRVTGVPYDNRDGLVGLLVKHK